MFCIPRNWMFRLFAIVVLMMTVSIVMAYPQGHPMAGGLKKSADSTKSMDSIPQTPLPTFDKVWISIRKSNGDSLAPMAMMPNELYALKGTDVLLRVTDCYSHWMIKGKAVNYSKEEKNPAVKVEILKGETVLYTRWAFKNIPFFGMNNMMGHTQSGDNQLYFTLTKYEGMKW
ncbi:MAG: hypothetical protein OEM52_00355 [bacterium]|nr:hypothetical protein [bacterium]